AKRPWRQLALVRPVRPGQGAGVAAADRPRVRGVVRPRGCRAAVAALPSPCVIYPLLRPRLHGWLDDLVALLYLGGALALGLRGAALAIAIGGAAMHFSLTRLTDYP